MIEAVLDSKLIHSMVRSALIHPQIDTCVISSTQNGLKISVDYIGIQQCHLYLPVLLFRHYQQVDGLYCCSLSLLLDCLSACTNNKADSPLLKVHLNSLLDYILIEIIWEGCELQCRLPTLMAASIRDMDIAGEAALLRIICDKIFVERMIDEILRGASEEKFTVSCEPSSAHLELLTASD